MKAIAPLSPVADPGAFQLQPAVRGDAVRRPEPTPQGADLRLVIEEDEITGTFIYKTMDRRTGEIVQQLPREEVLRLRDEPGYETGDIVDSTT